MIPTYRVGVWCTSVSGNTLRTRAWKADTCQSWRRKTQPLQEYSQDENYAQYEFRAILTLLSFCICTFDISTFTVSLDVAILLNYEYDCRAKRGMSASVSVCPKPSKTQGWALSLAFLISMKRWVRTITMCLCTSMSCYMDVCRRI